MLARACKYFYPKIVLMKSSTLLWKRLVQGRRMTASSSSARLKEFIEFATRVKLNPKGYKFFSFYCENILFDTEEE